MIPACRHGVTIGALCRSCELLFLADTALWPDAVVVPVACNDNKEENHEPV